MKQKSTFLIPAVLVAICLPGCQPAGRMRVAQEQLPGWQSDLSLETDTVRWAGAGDAEAERVLAEMPLPGARTGTPNYLLYLRLPAGAEQVDFEPGQESQGRGFFIQTRGEYAGLSRIIAGTVTVQGKSQARTATRQLELDLTTEDGSRISGTLQATRDEYRVSRFENKRRPADVQKLLVESSSISN